MVLLFLPLLLVVLAIIAYLAVGTLIWLVERVLVRLGWQRVRGNT